MPLSDPQVSRSRIHSRRIEIQGFIRDDGLLDLDARLTDQKDIDYPLRPACERPVIRFMTFSYV